MRVMLMIKGDPQPGAAPSEELLAAMGRYNEELQQAGVLLDLAGLLPSAEGIPRASYVGWHCRPACPIRGRVVTLDKQLTTYC